MSIRIDVVGGAQGKQQLDQVAKGVLGVRDAELAAARAIRERARAQKEAERASLGVTKGAFKAAGPLGSAGGIAGSVLGSVAALGPFSAAITAASGIVRNLIAAEQAHVESLLSANQALREFREGVSGDRRSSGEAAIGRLMALPDDEKKRLRKSGSARGKALIAAESVQSQIDEANMGNVGAGLAAMRMRLAAIRSPETARLLASFNEGQGKLDDLRTRADNTGPVTRIGERFGQLMGKATSELEYERAVEKQARAAELLHRAAVEMSSAISRASGGPSGGL